MENKKKEPYRHGAMRDWAYDELPDSVRPATRNDLFTASGRPNVGKQFLYWSEQAKTYIAFKIYPSTTAEDLLYMLEKNYIHVKK